MKEKKLKYKVYESKPYGKRQMKESIDSVSGLRHGMTIVYDPEIKGVKEKSMWNQGVRDGLTLKYNDGILIEEITYKNGVPEIQTLQQLCTNQILNKR